VPVIVSVPVQGIELGEYVIDVTVTVGTPVDVAIVNVAVLEQPELVAVTV